MKHKFPIYFVLLLLVVGACINPIDNFQQIAYKSFLTVDASISNEPGPYRISVSYSSEKIAGGYFAGVKKAKVYVTDERGGNFVFTESSLVREAGIYRSGSNFIGRVGGTYILHIDLADGKKYQSTPETMKAVPTIENLITQFDVQTQYPKGDSRRVGFNIYLDFQDPATEGDNYQWSWKHYERAPICETCYGGGRYNFTTQVCEYPRTPSDAVTSYKCEGNCWNQTYSTDLKLFTDSYLNGKRVTGKQVARVPFDGFKPYYLALEQRGLTKNSYNYYNFLTSQIQNNGTLFDISAETQFSINIKSTTNPDEKVLGIFDVYSVSKRIFFIKRDGDAQNEMPIVKGIPGSIYSCPPGSPSTCKENVICEDSPSRTPFKPEGWQDL